jgi:hypothetical protein
MTTPLVAFDSEILMSNVGYEHGKVETQAREG